MGVFQQAQVQCIGSLDTSQTCRTFGFCIFRDWSLSTGRRVTTWKYRRSETYCPPPPPPRDRVKTFEAPLLKGGKKTSSMVNSSSTCVKLPQSCPPPLSGLKTYPDPPPLLFYRGKTSRDSPSPPVL